MELKQVRLQLEVSMNEVQLFEKSKMAIETKLIALQQAVTQLTLDLKHVSDERDSIEAKLRHVGEAFYNTMSL